METFEYLELHVIPDSHYYIRRSINRQEPRPFQEDLLYYPGTHLDLGKYYGAQGWEIVLQAPNRSYLLKRRLSR